MLETSTHYNFFYLVEPAPEKWHVFELRNETYKLSPTDHSIGSGHYPEDIVAIPFEGTEEECKQWLMEHPKPVSKYRPFKSCDELIEVWCEKNNCLYDKNSLSLPLIWLKSKDGDWTSLVTEFTSDTKYDYYAVRLGDDDYSMKDIFRCYTFLDGSVCGVSI